MLCRICVNNIIILFYNGVNPNNDLGPKNHNVIVQRHQGKEDQPSTQRFESPISDTKDPYPKTEALKDHSCKDKELKDLVPRDKDAKDQPHVFLMQF